MTDSLVTGLDRRLLLFHDSVTARNWLAGLGVHDTERAVRDLRDLARRAVEPKVQATIAGQLHLLLPRCPDAGMALSNLERYVAASPEPQAVLRLLAQQARTTEALVQDFSTSQHFSEQIIRDPAVL